MPNDPPAHDVTQAPAASQELPPDALKAHLVDAIASRYHIDIKANPERWTPPRVAALRRLIDTFRRFVAKADEFVPADERWFMPDALNEIGEEVVAVLEQDRAVWDEGPATPAASSDVAPRKARHERLRAAVEHLLVDVPTESGTWCHVTDEGIAEPNEVHRSVWTEYVDEAGEDLPPDASEAELAAARTVERVSLCYHDPGVEMSRDLPRGGKWLRFEDLTATLTSVIEDLDATRSELGVMESRYESERQDVAGYRTRNYTNAQLYDKVRAERDALASELAAARRAQDQLPLARVHDAMAVWSALGRTDAPPNAEAVLDAVRSAVSDHERRETELLEHIGLTDGLLNELCEHVVLGRRAEAREMARSIQTGEVGGVKIDVVDDRVRASGWSLNVLCQTFVDMLDHTGVKNHMTWALTLPDGRELDLTAEWRGGLSVVQRITVAEERADAAEKELARVTAELVKAERREQHVTETLNRECFAHERDVLSVWEEVLGEQHEPPENIGAVLSLVRSFVERAERADAAEKEIAERRALLADVTEGRATTPTLDEIRAHEACGGAWLMSAPRTGTLTPHAYVVRLVHWPAWSLAISFSGKGGWEPMAVALGRFESPRWIALRNGLPCAWPSASSSAAEARTGEALDALDVNGGAS